MNWVYRRPYDYRRPIALAIVLYSPPPPAPDELAMQGIIVTQ